MRAGVQLGQSGCLCAVGYYPNPQYSASGITECSQCSGTCSGTTKHCSPTGALVCCGAGQYFVEGVSTACQTCAPGTYGSGGTINCTACPANTYSTVGVCTACPANTWSAAGASSCYNNSYPIFAIVSDNQGTVCSGATAPCGRYINLQTNAVSNINTGFNGYGAISLDGSFALLVDANDNVIKKLVFSSGVATTIAGSGTAGWVDGIGTNAQFNYPWDAAISPDSSYALIADCAKTMPSGG